MRTRRGIAALLALLMCLVMTISVAAAEEQMQFGFSLTVDGSNSKEVEPGDIITVVLKLKRQDLDEPYTMYAMQDEIRYDSTFFELVENSIILNQGISSTDIAMADQYRELYMNYLSMNGGNQWNGETMIGSFQLRVIGTAGVTQITNQDYLVSLPDGSGSYSCQAEDVTIILSTECVVTFETNGGSKLPDQLVEYGSLLAQPEDPVRSGYHLEGWYKDIHLTEKWDFETDTVQGNMTLYAKWAEGDPVAEQNQNDLAILVWGVPVAVAIPTAVVLKKKKRWPFNKKEESE